MTIEELKKIRWFGNEGVRFYDGKNRINIVDLSNKSNFFMWGEDRGDTFVNSFETESELLKAIKSYYSGKTGVFFETQVYLIVKNGVRQKVVVDLENY